MTVIRFVHQIPPQYELIHPIPVGAELAREKALTSAKSPADVRDPCRTGFSREEARVCAKNPAP